MSTSRLVFTMGAAQIQGSRSNQEDSYDVGVLQTSEQGELVAYSRRYGAPPSDFSGIYAIVADGMGGHDDGEKASAAVVAYFPTALARTGNLEDAAYETNEHLAELKSSGQIAANAGCTLVACLLHGTRLSTVSIGDSYIFVQRGQAFNQENELHTRGAQLDALVRDGQMTAEEAAREPKRGALTCAVMGRPLTYCDYRDEDYYAERYGDLQVNDRIFLMSDGVLTLGLETIAEMSIRSMGNPPGRLVQSILGDIERIGHPRQDNTTVLCVQGAVAGKTPKAGLPVAYKAAAAAGILLLAGGCAYGMYPLLRDKLISLADSLPVSVLGKSTTEQDGEGAKDAKNAKNGEKGTDRKKGKNVNDGEGEQQTPKSAEKSGKVVPAPSKEGDDTTSQKDSSAQKLKGSKAIEQKNDEQAPQSEQPAAEPEKPKGLSISEDGKLQGIPDIEGWLAGMNWGEHGEGRGLKFYSKPQNEQVEMALRLIYASQSAKEWKAQMDAKAYLSDVTTALPRVAEPSPQLRMLLAYYAQWSGGEWLKDYREACAKLGDDAPESVRLVRDYLAKHALGDISKSCQDVEVKMKEGKLELSCSEEVKANCQALARTCHADDLNSSSDEACAQRVAALLVVGGKKVDTILQGVKQDASRPNTSLLLSCHACRSNKGDWSKAFCDMFVGKEVETDAKYATLRQQLTLVALLDQMSRANDADSKTRAAQIREHYASLSAELKVDFLKHFYAGMGVEKISDEIKESLKKHLEKKQDPKGDIEEKLKTWHKDKIARTALYAELLSSASAEEFGRMDERTRAEALALVALHVVTAGKEQPNELKDFIKSIQPAKEQSLYDFLRRFVFAQLGLGPGKDEANLKEDWEAFILNKLEKAGDSANFEQMWSEEGTSAHVANLVETLLSVFANQQK